MMKKREGMPPHLLYQPRGALFTNEKTPTGTPPIF